MSDVRAGASPLPDPELTRVEIVISSRKPFNVKALEQGQ